MLIDMVDYTLKKRGNEHYILMLLQGSVISSKHMFPNSLLVSLHLQVGCGLCHQQ